VLALDSVRDPGNLGTIVRLADWFGIKTILASTDTVELYNPKVVQATMGSIFRIEVRYCDLAEVLAGQKSEGRKIYGTFLEGENIYTTDKDRNGIIVMGSESNGISPKVEACITHKITIPPFSCESHGPESLNVAIATAITCSEFRRNL
jgi:rRNA methylases